MDVGMQDPGSAKMTLRTQDSFFSREEFAARVARTARRLQNAGVDVLIAFANKVMPGHVRYLSGYETRHGIHDWSAFLLDPGSGRCALLSNVSWEPLSAMSWVGEISLTSLDRAGRVIAEWMPCGVRDIGIAGFNAFPAPLYRALEMSFPGVRLHDASQLTLEVRQIKSPAEVQVLRKCAAISDAGARAFLEDLQEGRSEREILVAVESALKLAGSDEVSFTTQVGSGPRTVSICPYPTDRLLAKGDLVQVDCGATFCGYRGDISRAATVGTPSHRQRLLLDVAAEMYEAMVEAMRPGVAACEIAAIGVKVARRHSLEDCLYRSPNHDPGFMGHSIGCSYHEPPEVNLQDRTELRENMLIVVEPILSQAGVGGVKLEDAVLITDNGAERLSSCPVRNW
jgi:Xaa-Pro aminopeptidase